MSLTDQEYSFINHPASYENTGYGRIVENHVLTATEADVYNRFMQIISTNRLLKETLQENDQQLKSHLSNLEEYKKKSKKKEDELTEELIKEKENVQKLQRQLEISLNESYVKQMKPHIEALSSIIMRHQGENSLQSDSQREVSMNEEHIVEAVQDLTTFYENDYVVVLGNTSIKMNANDVDAPMDYSKRWEATVQEMSFRIKRNKEKVNSLDDSLMKFQVLQHLDALEKTSHINDSEDYFRKFIEMKTKYDELADEQRHLEFLRGENQQLKVELDGKNKEIATKDNEIKKLKEENNEQSMKIKSLEDRSVEFRVSSSDESKLRINELEEQLQKAQEEIIQLAKINEVMKGDMNENSEMIEKGDIEIDRLEKNNSELQDSIKGKNEEIVKLQDSIKGKDEEIVKFKEAMKIFEEKEGNENNKNEASLAALIKEKDDENRKLKVNESVLKKRLDKYLDKMENLKKENNELKAEINKTKADGGMEQLASSTSTISLNDSIHEENIIILELDTGPPASDEVIVEVEEPSNSANEKAIIDALQSEIKEWNTKYNTLEEECEAWKDKYNDLEGNCNSLHQECFHLNKKMNKQDSVCDELTNENKMYKEKLLEKDEFTEKLQQELTRQGSELNLTKDTLTRSENDKLIISNKLHHIQIHSETNRQIAEQLKQTIDKLSRDKYDVGQQLQQMSKECYEKEGNLNKLQLSLEKYQSENQNLNSDLETYKYQVNEFEEGFKAERRARENQMLEMQKLKEDKERYRSERDRYRLELNELFENNMHRNAQPHQRNFNYQYYQNPVNTMPGRQQPKVNPHIPKSHNIPQQYAQQHQAAGGYDFPNTVTSETGEGTQKVCPICNEFFPDYDSLQIHVQECITNTNQ